MFSLLDRLAAAENSAALFSESKAFIRALTHCLPSESLPLPTPASTPTPPLFSSRWRTRIPDSANEPGLSEFAMTADIPIGFETKAEMPLDSPASPRLFSSRNVSRSQLPTSQTRVVSKIADCQDVAEQRDDRPAR